MSHKSEIQPDEEEDVRPFIKDSVYFAAKDGLSIALYSLLSNVQSESARNAIINQVGRPTVTSNAKKYIYNLPRKIITHLRVFWLNRKKP